MAKFKVLKWGDARGIGSIVQSTNLFGRVTTWTLIPDDEIDSSIFDKWVCCETGKFNYATLYSKLNFFYLAQYKVKDNG